MSSALSEVCRTFPAPLVSGRLVRRYKRFLADVTMPGEGLVTVHCPNSGSMLGCIEEGAEVFCSRSPAPGRRTAFTWEMIRMGGETWVGVNTMTPNLLAASAAEMRALPAFSHARAVRREVRLSARTRIDMVVERPFGPLFVEVKNVTLVREGVARFPDAQTERGRKHLEELMRIVAEGGSAAMFYVVQRGDAHAFGPASDIDPGYARLYAEARERGVSIIVVQARVTPEAVCLSRELPAVA